ncbi:MAG: lipopolysaccharide heptosyltransferase family protein, partial [Flavobacteriaceae bacterium]
ILFEALKETYPESELHYCINSHTFPVVENNPFIDEFVFITSEIESNNRKFYQFLKTIKKAKYDAVVDVYSKISSNLISRFTKANIKISKYKPYTSSLYTHTFKDAKKPKTNAGLAIENRLRLLKPFNVSDKIYRPKIYLTKDEIAKAQDLLTLSGIDLNKPLFMIGVLGSGPNKTYPLPHMADLIDTIVSETKGQVLFNYIPTQETEANIVYNFCQKESRKHIYLKVYGKSLREFFAITKHCSAFIGNEGGATNMAKALGIPTFTIFSPWIMKEAWNMFDDDKENVSIHLKDFKPELFQDKSKKDVKNKAYMLYEQFPPKYIIPKLKEFLKQF